ALSLTADSSAPVTAKIRLQIELRNGVIAIPSEHLAPGLIAFRSFWVLLNILGAASMRSPKLVSVWQGSCYNILVKPDQRGNKNESADEKQSATNTCASRDSHAGADGHADSGSLAELQTGVQHLFDAAGLRDRATIGGGGQPAVADISGRARVAHRKAAGGACSWHTLSVRVPSRGQQCDQRLRTARRLRLRQSRGIAGRADRR